MPDLATRADVVTYIAGTGRGGRGAVDAFLRLHRGPDGYDLLDAAQQRMGLAAIAGRGRNSLEFDAGRAQRALQRLADGDPSLPANAVGQRVTLTERDPSDTTIRIRAGAAEPSRTRPVTGQVVSVRPGPGPTVQVVIDRDGGPDQGDTPRAVQDVPADVELTMAPPRPAAAGAPAPDRPQQTAALDGAEASSAAVDATAAAVDERLVDGVVQSHIPGLPRMVMVAGRAVLVRGVDDGTVLVYDPDTQQAAAVPWERVMVSTASATRPIRIRLTEPQADELTVRVNDMFDGDPVRDASYGMRVRFRSWLDVHDPAAALSELDNALDIITDNLRSGGGDGQERTRWRSHQRVIENVRAKLVEAALPRQRPATPPVPADSAAPDRAAAAELPHVQPRDGQPWTPRPDGRVIPARLTALQWGNQAQFEYRAGRLDAALDAADNAAALDPEHPTRWPRLRRRIRGLPTVPAETPLLDNGDVDETTPEARRVGFQARVTAAWQVSDTDAMLLLLAEAGVEQPRVELDRLRQGVRSSSHVAAIMARYDAHHAHNGPSTEPPRRNVLAAGPRALNNRHELADHLRRATMAGTRLEEPHRQAIAGVIRWLEDRTEHARQVPEPFVPLEMDRHTVAAELRGLAAELDGRPEGAWMTSPAGGRLVDDLAAMAERLDEGAGYAARGRFAEASRQARDSYFTEERRPALVEALRDAGSADPEADAAFVYQGDPRRQYQLDTATDRLTNILYRLNPDKPQGIVAASPHTATMAAAAQQDGAPPTNGGPAVPGGAATPAATTMALDGPMRLLVADTPPAGAQVAGAALTVTDQAALTAWLTAQRSVYQDARGGEERRLWRAAGRMLDQLQQPASGTDVDTATSSTAAAASHRGTPPTTGDGVHPAAVAASAVSRRVTPPPTSSGTPAVDGAVRAVPGSPTAGVHPTRPGRGSMR